MNKISKKNKGFTLVEVLVAAVLLSFVVVGVLLMSTTNIKSNHYANRHSRAIVLAEEKMESMLRMPFDQLSTYTAEDEDYGEITNHVEFRRRTTVSVIDTDQYRITVTVNWKSQGKNSAPITFSIVRTR